MVVSLAVADLESSEGSSNKAAFSLTKDGYNATLARGMGSDTGYVGIARCTALRSSAAVGREEMREESEWSKDDQVAASTPAISRHMSLRAHSVDERSLARRGEDKARRVRLTNAKSSS